MSNACTSLFDAAGAGTAVIQQPAAAGRFRWLVFRQPVKCLTGHRLDEVIPCLERIEEAAAEGLHAAGFISYEAASAFDAALPALSSDHTPLYWFGLYRSPTVYECRMPAAAPVLPLPAVAGVPEMNRQDYRRRIEQIREYIAAGDCYQVNFTLRFQDEARDGLNSLFAGIASHGTGINTDTLAPCGACAACIHTGAHTVYSASPELFFSLDGDNIICRPMKGTAGRGRTATEDRQRAAALRASEKDRAENIMIVDMVRNDLGRICKPGSINSGPLFSIERYPSVFQMTSTVSGRTRAGLTEIFRALFPAASITGAPKIRAAEIIRELEISPRGIYTGAIGHISPGRRARFNVAIRTLVHDHAGGRLLYGSGGGIVWDSTAENEHAETLIKTGWLQPLDTEPFQLLETMRWHPRRGFFLLREHLDRMALSSQYFGFSFNRSEITADLNHAAAALPCATHRIRLLLDPDGTCRIEASVMDESAASRPWRVCLADTPTDRPDAFMLNKTTRRAVYDRELARHPGMDDVILRNADGDITESCRANVIARINGRWITPPLEDGLLNGTYREYLLRRKIIHEERLSAEDFLHAAERRLINSVRRSIAVELQGDESNQ